MKITAVSAGDVKIEQPSRLARAPLRTPAGESVLSTITDYVTELRHNVRTEGPFGGVRPEVIDQIRRDFAAGTFGGEADVDRALDALLREL